MIGAVVEITGLRVENLEAALHAGVFKTKEASMALSMGKSLIVPSFTDDESKKYPKEKYPEDKESGCDHDDGHRSPPPWAPQSPQGRLRNSIHRRRWRAIFERKLFLLIGPLSHFLGHLKSAI